VSEGAITTLSASVAALMQQNRQRARGWLTTATGPLVHGRTCGSCSACCYAFEVPEVPKPTSAWCPHCTQPGCGIYAQRPTECQTYACFWLLGVGGKRDRPDRLGAIVDFGKVLGGLHLRITRAPGAATLDPPPWMQQLAQAAIACGMLVESAPGGTQSVWSVPSVFLHEMYRGHRDTLLAHFREPERAIVAAVYDTTFGDNGPGDGGIHIPVRAGAPTLRPNHPNPTRRAYTGPRTA